MRAMQLSAPAPVVSSPLREVSIPEPEPGPGEVRVRVRCCGVCRTDLHVVEGDLPPRKSPVVPGHQVVGVVDRLGPGCSHLSVGQRVGIAWLRWTCGTCRFCLSGRENLCPAARFTGWDADGGYAEFAVVPERFAYEIPEGVPDAEAAPLLCAGIIGYRALERANPRPGCRLGLYGFGSSAHVVIQIALHRGYEVYVATRGESHRRLAREMGAAWVGERPSDLPVRVDAAILFAPAGELVPQALERLEPGGTLAIAGIYLTPVPPLQYERHLFYERDLRSVTGNTREDGRRLLAEAARAKVRPRVALYSLAEANRVLGDLAADRIDGTAVLAVG